MGESPRLSWGMSLLDWLGITAAGKSPEVGELAPEAVARDDEGREVRLGHLYREGPVLVYFYPKADTPGCTAEACSLRDEFAALSERGVRVVGVSADGPSAQRRFKEKYRLPFTLLADEDKKIVEAYGVWGEKSFMGRKYLGTNRVTFLIGPDGKIRKIWPLVKPEEHAAEVLAAL